MSYKPSRFGGYIGCVAFALFLCVAGMVAVVALGGYLPLRTFDAQQWRAVARSDDHSRLHMVEHLMWSGKLDGLTRQQVVRLLGPPSDSGYFSDWDLAYWLGPARGLFSLDSEWLLIRLGPDGRVAYYRTGED